MIPFMLEILVISLISTDMGATGLGKPILRPSVWSNAYVLRSTVSDYLGGASVSSESEYGRHVVVLL